MHEKLLVSSTRIGSICTGSLYVSAYRRWVGNSSISLFFLGHLVYCACEIFTPVGSLDRRLVLLDEASFLRRLKDLEEGERVAVLPLNRASNDEDLLFLRRKSRDDRRRAEEAHVIAAADVVVYEWGDDR